MMNAEEFDGRTERIRKTLHDALAQLETLKPGKEPEPTIEGRGKIEAGAVVRLGTVYEGQVLAVFGDSIDRAVVHYAKERFVQISPFNGLTLVKSAELRPGCTVRHKNGWQGFTKYQGSGLCVTWACELAPIGADENCINPANLTILRQPEGK